MQNIHPLLSDYLEELKEFKEGAFLDKTISIFYIKPMDKNMNLQVHIYRRWDYI